MTHRPCGACRKLVPSDSGCEHWKPGRSVKAADSAARRLAGRKKPGLPSSGLTKRQLEFRLRDEAKARVAEFARIMGGNYQ